MLDSGMQRQMCLLLLTCAPSQWAVLLCPSVEVEPETVPRPWLLPFVQQGAAFVVLGRKVGFPRRLVRAGRALLYMSG